MSGRLLLVDAGNSRIKWALAGSGGLEPGRAVASGVAGLAGRLDEAWQHLDRPESVHVSNVAGPAVAEVLSAWIHARWGLEPCFVRSEAAAHGVTNGYRQPERLGVDRWVGLVGLSRGLNLPACLVDCGTALTLDLLLPGGHHAGGLIAPGYATMKRALYLDASGIPDVATVADLTGLGRDTADGVEQGVILACAGLVEKTVRQLNRAHDAAITLVLTGGDAARIAPYIALDHRLDENMVLRGLLIIAQSS